jgi:hypothetical protein
MLDYRTLDVVKIAVLETSIVRVSLKFSKGIEEFKS